MIDIKFYKNFFESKTKLSINMYFGINGIKLYRTIDLLGINDNNTLYTSMYKEHTIDYLKPRLYSPYSLSDSDWVYIIFGTKNVDIYTVIKDQIKNEICVIDNQKIIDNISIFKLKNNYGATKDQCIRLNELHCDVNALEYIDDIVAVEIPLNYKRYYECTKCSMFGGPCYIHHDKETIQSVDCVRHDDNHTPKWKNITKEIYEENRNN